MLERREQGQSLQNKEIWIRSELRLFGKRANEFAKIMATKKTLKDIYFEVVHSSYRFVVDDKYSTDKNAQRIRYR
ncbi:replication initiation factor domain-containing protein [uncultured Streptococcus sp.]|uniref:replication initiation factor domain-containing protein n=1 Tax=uncultured Streptococcus sp. TaxID=83427 RepID=UPI00259184D3|nr:replication initiation factor domain-containing protein [uncultured Streptococcus sp.]